MSTKMVCPGNGCSNARLVHLVREVMEWHRDKDSADYNECEKWPCRWCELAQKAIDDLPNVQEATAPLHGRGERKEEGE